MAWIHLLENPKDVYGAKTIAATYCVDHFEDCAGENRLENVVNGFMYDALMLLALRSGGGARAGGAGVNPGGTSFTATAAAQSEAARLRRR